MDVILRNVHQIDDELFFEIEIKNLQRIPGERRQINTADKPLSLTTIRIVNHLRRLIIGRIPSWCIHRITDIRNNSFLVDDLIAKRLGQIPVLIATGTPDEDVAATQLSLSVRAVEGPEVTIVYSQDVISTSPNVKLMPNIEVMRLREKQELKFTALLSKGEGREHTKFCSVGLVSFRPLTVDPNGPYEFKVHLNGNLSAEELLGEAFRIFQTDLPVQQVINA